MENTQQYNICKSTLEGRVKLSGAKNSVLKLLTASLLTSEPVVISNYPSALLDAQIHIEMLEVLEEKTRGNLNEDEEKVLSTTLSELRMGYVRVAG